VTMHHLHDQPHNCLYSCGPAAFSPFTSANDNLGRWRRKWTSAHVRQCDEAPTNEEEHDEDGDTVHDYRSGAACPIWIQKRIGVEADDGPTVERIDQIDERVDKPQPDLLQGDSRLGRLGKRLHRSEAICSHTCT
jgi:hypothetical protein